MSQNQGDFTPVVKGGYKSDDAFHRRNWRHLSDFLRSNFVTTERLADGAVKEAKIDNLQVTDAKIATLAVDKLTTGVLSADVVMGATIRSEDEVTGNYVELSPTGLVMNDGTQDAVKIPTSGEALFRGGLEATSLASDEAVLSGQTLVDAGGSMIFASGVSNPGVKPTISWVYDEYAMTNGAGQYRGIDYDGTDSQLLACSPTNYEVYGFPIAGGDQDWYQRYSPHRYYPSAKPYGVTRLGSYIYVTFYCVDFDHIHINKHTFSGGPVLDSTKTVDVSTFPDGTFDYLSGMTNDGTDIWIGYTNTAGDVIVMRYNTSLVYQSYKQLEAAFGTTNKKVYDIDFTNVGTAYWWIVWGNNTTGNYSVRAYDNAASPARVSTQDFVLPSDSRGITHDGSNFLTATHNSSYWRKHSTWTSTSGYVHVAYTWRDSVGAYETKRSPQAYVAYTQRAKLQVSWPAFPTGVDRARIHMLEDNVTTAPSIGSMWRQSTESGSTVTYSTYTGSGNNDPSSNTFPESTPAVLVLPNKSSAPGSPVAGQVYFDTGTSKAYIYDGSAWNALW